MGREVTRLNSDKVDLAGNQTVTGPLTVRADLGVGTPNTGAQLRILRRQENGTDAVNHGALVLGNDTTTSASLRVGYDAGYSWLQGQGRQNLALNPRGGDVGVGTDNPRSRLSVAGGVAVGAAYAGASAAPANSLIVEGNLGVGTPNPQYRLDVAGNGRITGALDVTGAVNFGATTTRQMLNLWNADHGVGVQANTTYFRSGAHFAFYRGGSHDNAQFAAGANGAGLMSILNTGSVGIGTMAPEARLHVAGGSLKLDVNQEIFFADTGQIRSLDNAHRILFRRGGENKMELREYGDIIFSSGATAAAETARAVLRADGSFGIGTPTPVARLQVVGGAIMPAAGNSAAAGIQFPNDPGGGGGDSAWVRWYARTGEACTLEIGTANDPDDHVALMPSGNVGIGTVAPVAKLHVEGAARVNGALDVTGALNFGNATRQMVNLWGTGYGVGVQGSTTYFRSDGHYAFYRGGSHNDAALNAGGGVGLLSILNNGNVGIGTMNPAARLQVVDGAIMPAAGDSDAAGIMFPRDAFGGGGDAAWIRWVSRGGESTTLEIGCANDGDDHIALNPAGNVGIGTRAPGSKLHVVGGDIQWANGSILSTDQGGSIELGGNNGRAGTGVPFIDFHHGNGRIEDYNARIINDGDGVLTVYVRTFRYNGNVVMASSRELKDGIEELEVAEAERIVDGLSPVRYHMKDDETRAPHLGFIAEDVPEQVAALDRKAISPNHIIAALTRVVKEQQRRLDELTRRINGEVVNA
jgi:hypothetical protein